MVCPISTFALQLSGFQAFAIPVWESKTPEHDSSHIRAIERDQGLLDGQPDGFTFVFGLDDLLFEFVEPLAAFEDFT